MINVPCISCFMENMEWNGGKMDGFGGKSIVHRVKRKHKNVLNSDYSHHWDMNMWFGMYELTRVFGGDYYILQGVIR